MEAGKTNSTLFFLGILFIYLVLRAVAWKNTTLLEDHDSVSYLGQIKLFLTFDLQEIINMDPDGTPFYPFFGALCSLPGWSVETGARLCSLLFSSVLFLAVLGIGKQIAKRLAVAIGLLILSFSPVLISLSFSVLTEASYIATIYLGLWFFWTQYKEPKLWKGAILGIIFGLCFLNRTEGILYLAIIPLLQGAHSLFGRQKQYDFKRLTGWTFLFIISFSLLAIPQIWRVSHKMGHLAINGRQVWTLILKNPDGKSYEEKLYGLDLSPSQINLSYVQSHPEVIGQFVSKVRPRDYIEIMVWNYEQLNKEQLGILIGPLGLILFGFGLFALYLAGRHFEAFLVLAFIAFNLVGPLMHNVALRHIAVIAPLMVLIEGIGIVYLSQQLLEFHKSSFMGKHLPFVFLFVLIGASAPRLYVKLFRPPQFNSYFKNPEYSPMDLEEPVSIVQETARNELLRPPVIVARKNYLSYFAAGSPVLLPYTDYEGLVTYSHLNNIDFLFLQHRLLTEYPFLEAFLKDSSPPDDFLLVYRRKDRYGQNIELYRFQKHSQSTRAPGGLVQEGLEAK